jgi:hypothetical protein
MPDRGRRIGKRPLRRESRFSSRSRRNLPGRSWSAAPRPAAAELARLELEPDDVDRRNELHLAGAMAGKKRRRR